MLLDSNIQYTIRKLKFHFVPFFIPFHFWGKPKQCGTPTFFFRFHCMNNSHFEWWGSKFWVPIKWQILLATYHNFELYRFANETFGAYYNNIEFFPKWNRKAANVGNDSIFSWCTVYMLWNCMFTNKFNFIIYILGSVILVATWNYLAFLMKKIAVLEQRHYFGIMSCCTKLRTSFAIESLMEVCNFGMRIIYIWFTEQQH